MKPSDGTQPMNPPFHKICIVGAGAIGGWLAGIIVKGAGFGLIGNIVIGILGALLASWLLPQAGLGFSTGEPLLTSILYAMIGAVVILVVLSLVRRA